MKSPQSRQHKEKKVSYRRREHKNKVFYNSKAWRDTREAYLRHYQNQLFIYISVGKWKQMDLNAKQVSYLLSLGFQPCETCLRLYIADAYEKVEEGKELDHIEPVNPENALARGEITPTITSSMDRGIEIEPNYMFGDPFEFNNLQLLCKRHHAKKSQRER